MSNAFYKRSGLLVAFYSIFFLVIALFIHSFAIASEEYPATFTTSREYLINEYLDREQHQINYQNSKQSQNKTASFYRARPTREQLIEENMTVKWDEDKPEETTSFFSKFQKKSSDGDKYWDKYSFDFGVAVGHRVDDLRWDIAGTSEGTDPNVMSELTWSDLKMWQIKTNAKLFYDNRYVLEGMYASADIYEGDVQDSDYFWDDRTYEWSRSNDKCNDGEATDLSIGMGYKFGLETKPYFESDQFDVTLLAGYSQHEQKLMVTDGYQTLESYYSLPIGPFDGLFSSYRTKWKGPWLGVEMNTKIKKFGGLFRMEYHNVDYYAYADWNLRTTFQHPKSYDHTAEGSGLVFNLGVDYALTDNFTVDLKADIQDWSTGNGIDTVYFVDGTTSQTRLNSVDWRSYALMLGSTYHFN